MAVSTHVMMKATGATNSSTSAIPFRGPPGAIAMRAKKKTEMQAVAAPQAANHPLSARKKPSDTISSPHKIASKALRRVS
jgi:hypothetical protein